MPAQFSKFTFPLSLISLSVIAIITLHISTPVGAGLANDSAAYIAGARSILAGTGYSDAWLNSSLEPITHYPPLLSLCLAGIGYMGLDPLRGVRLLNIFLFGANTFVMGILGWKASGSRMTGIWAAILFLTNASLLRVHLYALSEGLYIFLSLLVFYFFNQYLQPFANQNNSESNRTNIFWLMLAGFTSGLAFLSRYSALALFPTFILAIILFQRSWQKRIIDAGVFITAGIPLIAAWFLRNKLTAGNATNRTFQFHPISLENIKPGIYNTSLFLIPVESWQSAVLKSGIFLPLLSILVGCILIWLGWSTWKKLFHNRIFNPSTITYTTSLYFFGYIFSILFSMSFFDASTKLQPRILSPLFTSFILLISIFTNWSWNYCLSFQNKNKFNTSIIFKYFIILIAVILTCVNTYGLIKAVNEFRSAGQGYASWKWHDSIVMNSLKNLPTGTIIYTNSPPAVYLVIGLTSRTLPTRLDPVDKKERTGFDQDVAAMRAELLSGSAVLAFFDETPVFSQDQTENMGSTSKNNYDKFISGLKILKKTQGDVLYGIK